MCNVIKPTQRLIAAACCGMMTLPLLPAMVAANPPENTAVVQPSQSYPLPAGFMQKDLTSQSGIKTGLVKMTERAVIKGDFNTFLAELAVQDRARAREFKNVDQRPLDEKIDDLQKAWKNKYNQDFDLDNKNVVFNDQVTIIQGQVSDPPVAIDNWPAPAAMGQAVSAADRNRNITDEQKQISEAKLTKGRDVAVVHLPGCDGLPEISVSMIFHYPDFWRVDVPNDRTGEQIYNDLITQLDYMDHHQDQWPAKVEDGYRMVAAHAAAALYGVDTTLNGGHKL